MARTPGAVATPDGVALTPRQRDVLALVATGATNRVIARQLHISERTVRKHLDDLRSRLQLPNRVAAARWWFEQEPRQHL